MILESSLHLHSSFLTLTYRPEKLTYLQNGLATLTPSDLKNWLKRLRKAIEPSKIRFFAVGEYGDRHQRPHYHVCLFGYKPCAYGESRYKRGAIDCCESCDTIRDTWGLGIIECKALTRENAAYAAGYVMKKMTSKQDARLEGRHPEFTRQSLKPGLGAHLMPEVARTIKDRTDLEDVPTAVRVGGKIMPLGRYLRKRIRIELGGDGTAPQAILTKMEEEMLPLLEAAKVDPTNITLKKQIVARCRGEVASLKARTEIHSRRKRNGTL